MLNSSEKIRLNGAVFESCVCRSTARLSRKPQSTAERGERESPGFRGFCWPEKKRRSQEPAVVVEGVGADLARGGGGVRVDGRAGDRRRAEARQLASDLGIVERAVACGQSTGLWLAVGSAGGGK